MTTLIVSISEKLMGEPHLRQISCYLKGDSRGSMGGSLEPLLANALPEEKKQKRKIILLHVNLDQGHVKQKLTKNTPSHSREANSIQRVIVAHG